MTGEIGSTMQRQLLNQLLVYGGLLWIVMAICMGLWASEIKKRSFWAWCGLSLLLGPIAWYYVMFRLPLYIPPELRIPCPKCGREVNKNDRRCRHCRAPLPRDEPDRAADVGRQAATMVFAARRLFGNARRATTAASGRPATQPRFCAQCGTGLVQQKQPNGVRWVCPKCGWIYPGR